MRAREVQLNEAARESANLAQSVAQHAYDTLKAADTALVGLVARVEKYRRAMGVFKWGCSLISKWCGATLCWFNVMAATSDNSINVQGFDPSQCFRNALRQKSSSVYLLAIMWGCPPSTVARGIVNKMRYKD